MNRTPTKENSIVFMKTFTFIAVFTCDNPHCGMISKLIIELKTRCFWEQYTYMIIPHKSVSDIFLFLLSLYSNFSTISSLNITECMHCLCVDLLFFFDLLFYLHLWVNECVYMWDSNQTKYNLFILYTSWFEVQTNCCFSSDLASSFNL